MSAFVLRLYVCLCMFVSVSVCICDTETETERMNQRHMDMFFGPQDASVSNAFELKPEDGDMALVGPGGSDDQVYTCGDRERQKS